MKKELEKIAYMYGDVNLKKQRKKRQKLLIKDLCVDYAHNSTLHGLRYMTESGLTLTEKLFWLATFLVSVGLCGYLIGDVYHKWTTSPVIVTVSEKLVSVDSVPFPSVTICPQIKSQATVFNFGEQIHKIYESKKKYENISEKEELDEMLQDISLICNYDMTDLSNRNFTSATLLVHIDTVSPQIYDVFESCYWHGSKIPCWDLFQEVYTAEGKCFNMNGLAAREMFRDTVQSIYPYSRRNVLNRGWSLQKGYSVSEDHPFPRRGTRNHASPDLVIFLKSQGRERDPLCNGLKSGYEIYLHHPSDFPQTSLYRYSAVNNQVTSLAVSVHVERTSDRLIGYSADVRQCHFLEDRYLRYFQNYTAKNCEAECLSNYTYSLCSCVGYYMPHDNSTELCAENKLQCMRLAYNVMAQRELALKSGEEGCRGRPACQSVEYDAEVLKTNFESDNYEGKTEHMPMFFLEGNNTYTNDTFTNILLEYYNISYNISKVEIYFKKPQFMSTQRSELFGKTEFLANIGGLLGLFLGFSFLSLIEIFYFLTLRLGIAIRRDRKEEEKKGSDEKNNAKY